MANSFFVFARAQAKREVPVTNGKAPTRCREGNAVDVKMRNRIVQRLVSFIRDFCGLAPLIGSTG